MSNINVETITPKGPQITESLTPASTALTRGLAVIYTAGTDGQGASLQTTAGADVVGIVAEDAIAGLPVLVVSHGPTVAEIGAAVVAGNSLAVNAQGQLVPAASGNVVVAKALSGNPNAGDFITVLVSGSYAVHP